MHSRLGIGFPSTGNRIPKPWEQDSRPLGIRFLIGREHLFVVRSVPGKAVTAPGGWHSCEEVIIFRASLITFMPWGGRAGEPGNFIWIMGQSPAFLHFI
ncbi:hypothetical protein [Prevotella denticola]|uniref:hypothetical protein n=1 Tax=Prevotella denticola TaxID=28129 RepID=UPI0028E5FEEA|nr:hypothetical protein [Prevotella denticola]